MFSFNKWTWDLYFKFGESLYWDCIETLLLEYFCVEELTPQIVDFVIESQLWKKWSLSIVSGSSDDFASLKWLILGSSK